MFRSVGLLIFASLIVGCHHAGQSVSNPVADGAKSASVDPMTAERDGVHQGAYLLGQAASDLETAVDAAKKVKSASKNADLKAAMNDVLQSLDDAGAGIADFTGEPPELAEFKADFAKQDDRRLNAINASNDALHDLDDVGDTLSDFSDGPTAAALDDLESALDAAADNLTEAIKALGGKVENDDTEDVTPADSSKKDARQPEL
jgi:hypothetical protein